jgi:hypothetical protein
MGLRSQDSFRLASATQFYEAVLFYGRELSVGCSVTTHFLGQT